MLKRIVHGKHMLLAFDKHYRMDGTVDLKRTTLHTPDDWVHRVCEKHPDVFLPSCSVHPYRPDALEALETAHRRGVKLVKWLPNSMGIDPLNAVCDAFYDRVRDLGMTILSHAGEERAVEGEGRREKACCCNCYFGHCWSLWRLTGFLAQPIPRRRSWAIRCAWRGR